MSKRNYFFVHHLLDWFYEHQRDLPWRRDKNPYHIWVSEIMLQQTRVDTVIPYFHRFIEKFPTIEALAEAPEEEVLKSWEGLGYYSRARNLQSAVREVREKYDAIVPRDKQEISSLKGVGPYTAGAILSIAYDLPEPAVDGNVMRVLSRFYLIEEDITKARTRTDMEDIIREIIPFDAAGDFNQALMELGALVCTPKSPNCEQCPVNEYCIARMEGMQQQLPIKKKAKPPRKEKRLVALIECQDGEVNVEPGSSNEKNVSSPDVRILIRQRPADGLLAQMWELPHVEVSETVWQGTSEQQMEALRTQLYEFDSETKRFFMETSHVFSHIHWEMKVYRYLVEAEQIQMDDQMEYRWITLKERDNYAFPNVFLRILKEYESESKSD